VSGANTLAEVTARLIENAKKAGEEAIRLGDAVRKGRTEAEATMMWPIPSGMAQITATMDVVQGLAAKLERMNVEMQN